MKGEGKAKSKTETHNCPHSFCRAPCRPVRAEGRFDAKIVIGGHCAKGQGLVGHDERRLIANEHDDVALLLEQLFRHRAQAVEVGRPPPRAGRAGIDLTVDKSVRRIDGQHEPRPVGLPLGRHRPISHPQAEEAPALIGRSLVDRAALSGRAMLAPDTGRFGEFGQRIDLAAERAGAAFASRRGRIGRKEHGGGGHWRASLGRVDAPDRYRDRLGLASSINLCAQRRPPTRTRQPGIWWRAEISNLFMTSIVP